MPRMPIKKGTVTHTVIILAYIYIYIYIYTSIIYEYHKVKLFSVNLTFSSVSIYQLQSPFRYSNNFGIITKCIYHMCSLSPKKQLFASNIVICSECVAVHNFNTLHTTCRRFRHFAIVLLNIFGRSLPHSLFTFAIILRSCCRLFVVHVDRHFISQVKHLFFLKILFITFAAYHCLG